MNLPIDIIVFYSVAFILLTYFFHKKTRLLISVAISMLIVLVASEYYEIPIFVAGFLGLSGNHPYPSLPFLLHHINTIMLFIWLICIAEVKLDFSQVFLMVFGILINTVLLFMNPSDPNRLWFARFVGIYVLSGVIFVGSSLVGVKS